MRHGGVRGFTSVVAKQGLFVYFCPFVHVWAAFFRPEPGGTAHAGIKTKKFTKRHEKDFVIGDGSGSLLLHLSICSSAEHESGFCKHGGFAAPYAGIGFGPAGVADLREGN